MTSCQCHTVLSFHCLRCDDMVEDCQQCHICEEYWSQLLEEADQFIDDEPIDTGPEDMYYDCGD